jgi:hypothetical protein
MIPPSFTPFSDDGMSIITAIFLFFCSIICGLFAKAISERFTDHEKRLDDHDEKITSMNVKLAVMDGKITTTQMIVQRIDDSMTELGKTNQYLIKHILEK